MKILITSGGTTEAIDRVRGITNHSTGHLGKIIAEQFLGKGHEVTLVTTKQAVKPQKQDNLDIRIISNVNSLIETLKPLVETHEILIHSMAVSDYTPVYMTDLNELKETSSPALLLNKINKENKISSDADYQVLFLKKNPKVISLVKQWNPKIQLVGFKLLVGVSPEELINVARKSLEKNQAELIVANDLNDITQEQHIAYLIDKTNVIQAKDKQDIAQKLYERVT